MKEPEITPLPNPRLRPSLSPFPQAETTPHPSPPFNIQSRCGTDLLLTNYWPFYLSFPSIRQPLVAIDDFKLKVNQPKFFYSEFIQRHLLANQILLLKSGKWHIFPILRIFFLLQSISSYYLKKCQSKYIKNIIKDDCYVGEKKKTL